VADAKVTLADSEKSLAEVMYVDSEAVAQAENTLVAAKIVLENAQEALDATLSGPTADDVAKAQLKVDSTDTSLTNAYRDEKIIISEWDDKIKTAEDTLATAVESYKLVFSTWLGIALDEEQQYQNPDVLLDLFGVSLESLFDSDSRFSIQKLGTSSTPTSDNPDTEWDELIVYTWLNFYPGIVYPTCSANNISERDPCIQQELEDGFKPVQQAVDMLEITNISASKSLANAEITIANSKDSSSTALQALEDLNETPAPLQIEALEMDIVVAQAALHTAVDELASLLREPNEVDLEAERMNVLLSKAYLDIAEQDLQELAGDPDPIALDALEKQLDVDVEKLRVAEKDLAELQQDPDPLIVALREKDLAAAQSSLDSTLETLETTAITAPWNGIISAVNVDVGQNVNLNISAIEIINPTVVEIDGAVDEIDVLYLREGATASITLDALPGQTLEGSVFEIATQSTNQQGIVTYPISIRVETNGMQLPQGLTAVASIVLREDNDVLLIPLDALYGSFDNPLVRVSINGQIKERSVELGNTDDFWVTIISGVAESELIVIQSQQAETSFGWGGFGRGGFGGFGGSSNRNSSSRSGGPPN
jgi:RND family efflux transporter MFP subunit